MYGNIFVDEGLLYRGIYEASRPTIRTESSLDEIIKNHKKTYDAIVASSPDYFGLDKTIERFIGNIKQCKLVKVKISIVE